MDINFKDIKKLTESSLNETENFNKNKNYVYGAETVIVRGIYYIESELTIDDKEYYFCTCSNCYKIQNTTYKVFNQVPEKFVCEFCNSEEDIDLEKNLFVKLKKSVDK